MNDLRTRPLSKLLAAAAIGLAALAGCQSDPGPVPLEGARMGGPFTLTDQNGRPFSSQALAGKYPIVYFGYTFCPDICPVDMALINAALRQFEQSDPDRAAKIVPVFITTDPQRDTPQVLREFAGRFHPRTVALTGTPEDIQRVARAYGIYASRRATGEGADSYLVDHSRHLTLFGPEGQPIMFLREDQGPGAIVEALDRWVR
jgi:protein SCO1/2